MKIKDLRQEGKVDMSGPMFIIVDKRDFWHRIPEYPKSPGEIFYKSKKYNDYRIEFWNLAKLNFESIPYHWDAWMQFIESEEVEKWCYLRDLLDIIDNDDFVSGELYLLINHI